LARHAVAEALGAKAVGQCTKEAFGGNQRVDPAAAAWPAATFGFDVVDRWGL